VEASQFVLNPLASAEVVLSETDRQMGCIVCDMGGGTTDLAIYVDGDVWHTMVLPVGGTTSPLTSLPAAPAYFAPKRSRNSMDTPCALK
jgi:Ethanolamine utilization protein EutJ (predicted chaperonin)